MKFDRYKVLTFDCYGTLIDWESGLITALDRILDRYNIQLEKEKILELFAEFESQEEQQETFRNYREVLKNVVRKLGDRLRFKPTEEEINSLPESIKDWQPFPDTVEALGLLKQHFKLGIISNIDDDLFAATAKKLKIDFDWVITAQQVKSYKPSQQNFQIALNKIGLASDSILHVAQSLYHDVVPANALGLSTVWVNRRANKKGFGATKAAERKADLEVTDLKTLATFAIASQS
jgi:2-haloacid dehalogenase